MKVSSDAQRIINRLGKQKAVAGGYVKESTTMVGKAVVATVAGKRWLANHDTNEMIKVIRQR